MSAASRLAVILVVALISPGLWGQIRVIPEAAGITPPRATDASPTARSPLSTAQLVIGGPGTRGRATAPGAAIPPSGLLEFRYDAEAGTLVLRVSNTCGAVPDETTPRITRILFNLPRGAVTGMTLVGQAAPGSVVPAFELHTEPGSPGDSSLGDPRALGRFGALLEASFAEGIASRSASGSVGTVTGPVSFSFALSGPALRGLCASAFSGSFSAVTTNRIPVNAALEFAGAEGSVGSISNAPVATAAAWYAGRPVPGGAMDLVLSGAPGSFGGILCSPSPGPTMIAGITVPLGLPALVAIEGILPPSAVITRRVEIPPNPKLAGTIIHCVAVTVDPGMCGIAISNAFDLHIEATETGPKK